MRLSRFENILLKIKITLFSRIYLKLYLHKFNTKVPEQIIGTFVSLLCDGSQSER